MFGKHYDNMTPKDKALTKVTQSIIANEVANNFNWQIRDTGYYKGVFKKKLNALNKDLEHYRVTEFEKFWSANEQFTDELYQAQEEMVKQVCSLGAFNFAVLTEIIKAYKLDPKAMEGIVRTINKRNGKKDKNTRNNIG